MHVDVLAIIRPVVAKGERLSTLTLSCWKYSKWLSNLLKEYSELFEETCGLPPKWPVEHEIHLIADSPLPNLSMYRNLVLENKEIKRQINKLLEHCIIKPSNSPCGSLVVLVPKKDGGWRMYIDYSTLNKIIVKNRYPLSLSYQWPIGSYVACNYFLQVRSKI